LHVDCAAGEAVATQNVAKIDRIAKNTFLIFNSYFLEIKNFLHFLLINFFVTLKK
jgi:hypothetical protein